MTSFWVTPENSKAFGLNGSGVPAMLAVGGSSTLAGLSDVAISGLADLDLLQYNAGTSKWSNVPSSGFQPSNANLTSISALTTAAYGLSVLETANAASLRTLAGLGTAATATIATSVTNNAVPTIHFAAGIPDRAITGFNISGKISFTAPTGTGSPVWAISPTLTTPNLGTPSALTLTNATGLPLAGLVQGGATSGQALAWNGTAWAPATISSGITIGTTTSNGTAGHILYTDGTNVQAYATIDPSKITGTALTGGTLTGVPTTGDGTTALPLINIRPTSGVTTVTTQNPNGTGVGVTLQDASQADFFAFWRSNTPLGAITYQARFRGMEMVNTGASGFQIYNTQANGQGENAAGRTGLFGDVATGLRMASNYQVGWSANAAGAGDAYSIDTQLVRAAAGVIGLLDASTGGASLELTEQSAPSAPGANKARIFLEDNGGGKSRLMVRFPSGASQQIAIEP